MKSYEEARKIAEGVAKDSFDLGWNAAVVTIAQAIENMKALGDTATSFATFVKEFTRGDMAFSPFSATDAEEQQASEVQSEQP
jgi:hypothetical protein